MFKKTLLALSCIFFCAGTGLFANYGVNTHCYEFTLQTDTPAPEGYKPVYLSHYGRHGSRTGINIQATYDQVINTLIEAKNQKLLTKSGDSLLNEARFVNDYYQGMDGALTEVGQAEEHRLAEIIYNRFTPVFKNGPKNIRVETSTVPRSIVSGECFIQTLTSKQPDLVFSFNTGNKYFSYINNGSSKEHSQTVIHLRDSINALFVSDGREFCERIFTSPEKALALIGDPDKFQHKVWEMAREGRASGLETDMFRHLPMDVILKWRNDEIYDLYMRHGNSLEYGYERMTRTEPLVRVMLEQAKHALDCGDRCADLKFGHDHPLIALAGYFGLDGVGERYGWKDLPDAWADPMNIPLASNMQMVFYRNGKTGDVLVKFIYNGREKKLRALTPVSGPYYRWSEVYAAFIPKGDEYVFNHTDWHWRDFGNGGQVGYAQLRLFDSPQSISVVRYPMSRMGTFLANDPAKQSDSTSAIALRHGGIAAINASYFNMRNRTPVTYTKDDGKQEGWTTPDELFRVDGVVAMSRNGKKVSIFRSDTLSYDALCKNYHEAIAGGPMLLVGGNEARQTWPYTSFYYGRHPRTVIGTTADGMVYLIVIDGRFKEQGIGTSIHETAEIARMFGLCDALNLDGGGSSVLWTGEFGTISQPYDNKKYDHFGQRKVPNIIYVK